jgi:hypothetical protein
MDSSWSPWNGRKQQKKIFSDLDMRYTATHIAILFHFSRIYMKSGSLIATRLTLKHTYYGKAEKKYSFSKE